MCIVYKIQCFDGNINTVELRHALSGVNLSNVNYCCGNFDFIIKPQCSYVCNKILYLYYIFVRPNLNIWQNVYNFSFCFIFFLTFDALVVLCNHSLQVALNFYFTFLLLFCPEPLFFLWVFFSILCFMFLLKQPLFY